MRGVAALAAAAQRHLERQMAALAADNDAAAAVSSAATLAASSAALVGAASGQNASAMPGDVAYDRELATLQRSGLRCS